MRMPPELYDEILHRMNEIMVLKHSHVDRKSLGTSNGNTKHTLKSLVYSSRVTRNSLVKLVSTWIEYITRQTFWEWLTTALRQFRVTYEFSSDLRLSLWPTYDTFTSCRLGESFPIVLNCSKRSGNRSRVVPSHHEHVRVFMSTLRSPNDQHGRISRSWRESHEQTRVGHILGQKSLSSRSGARCKRSIN